MSIKSEQNILGDSALANITRPGLDTLVAHYSFSNKSYEQMTYEAMANARGGSWARPTFYAPDTAVAEAEEGAPSEETGPAGETELSEPTQYGTKGGAPLTENADQTTALEQVAEIIAEETEATEVVLPDIYASSVRSETITEESAQGPVSSGGQFNGYESSNQYYQNPVTEATTLPAPIESTGLRSVTPTDLDPTAGVAAQSTDLGGGRPMEGAPSNSQADREKTTGASAVKGTTDGRLHKVHKPKGRPMDESGGSPTDHPMLDQSGNGGGTSSSPGGSASW